MSESESTLAAALDRMRIFLAALDAAGIPNDTALLDIREENGYLHVLCPADLRAILAATPTAAHVAELEAALAAAEARLRAVEALADEWAAIAGGVCGGCDSCDGARHYTLMWAADTLAAALATPPQPAPKVQEDR